MTRERKGKNMPLFVPPASIRPLADRVRPRSFGEYVGQEHLVGPGGTITKMLKAASLRSMILWGPPGTGKTTLAELIAQAMNADYFEINAVSSGVKEIREIIATAEGNLATGTQTILFIDEIHRFNKAQQDALLASVEDGTVTLIGNTTENPSFEVIAPLMSRCNLYILVPLTDEDLDAIINGAFEHDEIIKAVEIEDDARAELKALAGSDARVMLNALEAAVTILGDAETRKGRVITREVVREAYQTQHFKYDKTGDMHYDTISAFIKSVRGSDPDAALHYLARMIEAGEDPKFIARRLIVLASEDIGNAEPYALTLATACFTAVNYVGMPESSLILSQTTTYLSSCPKSNSSTLAISRARRDVMEKPFIPVPLHLRNAPTKLMKELEYGKGYKSSHASPDHFVEQEFLPEDLKDRIYYEPTEIGREAALKKYLEAHWKKRKKPDIDDG